MDTFVRSIADAGFVNSLAQLLIKIGAPGVPDFYQGTEFWDFNLVDPDNRRPVDFTRRRELLSELAAGSKQDPERLAADVLDNWPDERIKLLVTWRGLQCRQEFTDLFLSGEYQPLSLSGPHGANACAFARVAWPRWAICIVPRLAQAAWAAANKAAEPARGQTSSDWPAVAAWWQETSVKLPADAPRRFRHAFTRRDRQRARS